MEKKTRLDSSARLSLQLCGETIKWTLFFLTIGYGECLRLLSVRAPSVAGWGQSVELECRYVLENEDVLYAVKWYKNADEFYRYVLAEKYPVSVFPLPGVKVNISESSDRKVTLDAVSLQTTGAFRCEVSAEAPSFQTVHGLAHLTVIRPPESGPEMTALRKDYRLDEELESNCSSDLSQPETGPQLRLSWHLNKRPVSGPFVREWTDHVGPNPKLRSSLKLKLTKEHFDHGGFLHLSCTASFSTFILRRTEATTSLRWEDSFRNEQFPIQQLRGPERSASYASSSSTTEMADAILNLLVLMAAFLLQRAK